jgi:Ca2+-binding RTX toxin-like protein
MGTTISVGGGDKNVVIYGNGTVFAGNGNDTITIHGKGSVLAGSGNDSISVGGRGGITVGSGSDTVTLWGSGNFHQDSSLGNDTITLGFGSDTIFEAGNATVHGVFGDASISGGTLAFANKGTTHVEDALSGAATLVGGQYSNEFVGGSGTTVMKGGLGNDTFVSGSGDETMSGGKGANVFAFIGDAGGTHVITNFVSGHDHLYLEGYSLSYLNSQHDVKVQGGNTYITLDGGKTTIELQGVTKLGSSDITHHKP